MVWKIVVQRYRQTLVEAERQTDLRLKREYLNTACTNQNLLYRCLYPRKILIQFWWRLRDTFGCFSLLCSLGLRTRLWLSSFTAASSTFSWTRNMSCFQQARRQQLIVIRQSFQHTRVHTVFQLAWHCVAVHVHAHKEFSSKIIITWSFKTLYTVTYVCWFGMNIGVYSGQV